jgi:type II pantothenate kinase
MLVAIDFGLTNLKIAHANASGEISEFGAYPNPFKRMHAGVLREVLKLDGINKPVTRFVVTGGQSAKLPDEMDGVPVVKVHEVDAIGRGGLLLAKRARIVPTPREALVVSCGTGTAMIAVRKDGCKHSGGTAVGGGTLLGLGRLLLGATQAQDMDALAQEGNPANVDLTLIEATGGEFGKLPPDATAVNFGKLAGDTALAPSRADLAAALVTMIAQTIALIAINTAKHESLETIILVGRLASLPSIQAQLFRTAGFYQANFVTPEQGGYAPLYGAIDAVSGSPAL